MRVFGREAPEIIPHASDDAFNLGLRKSGKGAVDVAPSMSGHGEKRTNGAPQRTTEGGRTIERQNPEYAK